MGTPGLTRLSVDDVLGPGSPLARRLPGYERRDGQLEMARAVHTALEMDEHLFVEAGTGTGKTFAYLIPAILSGRKIVVSTATHALQEQIFEKDIPLVREVLAEHGIEVRAAVMKGLSNYLCKRRFSERMKSGERVDADLVQIERWALATRTGDRAELETLSESAAAWRDVQSGTDTRIGAGCKYYDECFVTQMRRDAEQAQIVVVNHHLFFADLALKTGRAGGFGGAIPPYDAVIFDEAHQIEGVATDFFGVRVSTARVDRLVRDARRGVLGARILDSSSMRVLDGVEIAARGFFESWKNGTKRDEGRRLLGPDEWTPVRREAISLFDASLQALAALSLAFDEDDSMAVIARRAADLRTDLARLHAPPAKRPPVSEEPHWTPEEDEPLAFDPFADPVPSAPPSGWKHPQDALLRAAAVAGFEGGIAWVDVSEAGRNKQISLGASPVDLAPVLRERLFERVASVVCTSATLATSTHTGPSFHFAKGRLGSRPETRELVVPSPFDFRARAALYVADDMPEPGTPLFEGACAERAAELAAITGGGAFVLCTSTRAMRAIHAALLRRAAQDPNAGLLLVQGEAPKHVLLDRFRAETDAILVATMSFWEGVDVPGRALRLVVIDKIPFAVPTEPVVAARSAKIEVEGGNPFTQYAVPAAAITLKQGFGRLIRTREDAGIVALLDRRAVKRGYGRALLESLPPAKRVRSLAEVRDFWHAID